MSLVHVTGVAADLFVSKTNLFFGEKIYTEDAVYLVSKAAEALKRATVLAQSYGFNIVVLDAYRPMGLQQILFDASSKDGKYVKSPDEGNHCKGIAVDITLQDSNKINLIQQTLAGSWIEASHAFYTDQIPMDSVRNRLNLQLFMIASGWLTYKYEWWHFDLSNDEKLLSMDEVKLIQSKLDSASDDTIVNLSTMLKRFEESQASLIKAAFIQLLNIGVEDLIQIDASKLTAIPKNETIYPSLDERPLGMPSKELDDHIRMLFEKNRKK